MKNIEEDRVAKKKGLMTRSRKVPNAMEKTEVVTEKLGQETITKKGKQRRR